MNEIDIKIVGAVSDEYALEEIENIAKVFAYEQRMKSYTSPLKEHHLANHMKIKVKKPETSEKIHCHLPSPMVKGLC